MLAGVLYSGLVAAKDKKLLDGGYNLQVAIHRVKVLDATKRF
ncbi:unnamed protein product [Rhodiola kirilowii]